MSIRPVRWLLPAVLAVALTGCGLLGSNCLWNCGRETHSSTSLVGFLYPAGNVPPQDDLAELKLPLRVGLTMLPSPGGLSPEGLSAAQREQLLGTIRERFKDRKFIADIVQVPDYYLTGKDGFASLAGVQRLYNLDVIAIVSYDQTVHSEGNTWSLGYLTIVGAAFLKGDHADVSTLVDLAVIEPKSRALLLRAGGTDATPRNMTATERDIELTRVRGDSFRRATLQLNDNFDKALLAFEQQVRDGTAPVRVARRTANLNGGGLSLGGGGALDLTTLALLLLLGVVSIGGAATNRRSRLAGALPRPFLTWRPNAQTARRLRTTNTSVPP